MSDLLDPDVIVEQPLISLGAVDQELVVKEPIRAPANQHISEEAIMVPPEDLNDDIITLSIKDDELPDAVLKAVLLGLAEEQQAIKNLREKKQKDDSNSGRVSDTSHISLKRGTLLKYMSETLIERQALVGGSGEIDLKSPKFREIIKMFLSIIADTFDEVKIPAEYRDLFFQALAHKLEGWEMRAEKILRNIR
jgi:hypothetical protein